MTFGRPMPESLYDLQRELRRAWDLILYHDQEKRKAQETLRQIRQIMKDEAVVEQSKLVAIKELLWPSDDAA